MERESKEAKNYVWEGEIPLQIRLHESEVTTLPSPPPALILASRIGYLPLLVPLIKPFFSSALPPGVDTVWFDYKGLPLKWYIPTGVLFDLLCAEPERPWNLTVHFRGYPANILTPCEDEDSVKWSFINSLKEAAYIINGNCKNVMNMSQTDQVELWRSVMNGNLEAYLRVSSKLKLGIVGDAFSMRLNSSSIKSRERAGLAEAGTSSPDSSSTIELKSGEFGESYCVMNCLFHTYSEIIFSRTSFVFRNSVCGLSTPSWKRHSEYAAVKTVNLDFLLTTFRAQCYATQRVTGSKSRSKKVDQEPKPVMKAEKDKFFVVRKGDLVGVYRSLSECQAQVGTSICDPPATVYKGCSLPKDTETYLLSSGLKNALYSIRAADLTEGLFGTLVPCPFQQLVPVKGETSTEDLPRKRLLELLGPETGEAPGSTSLSNAPRKHVKLDHHLKTEALISGRSCILEFDGASKGNPGQAGAGVVLRADDGTLICRLREGLGIATNNVAEYRAMILGLRYALEKGFTSIRVMGDSKLVCMQVQGLWKVKNQSISRWYEEAKKLMDRFLYFQITHVLRDLNSDADAQANLAVGLADGQVQEEFDN